MNDVTLTPPMQAPELYTALLELLAAGPSREVALGETIERHLDSDAPVCSTLLQILTHLSFDEPGARAHWRKIGEHRRGLAERLDRDLGLRVATLDYFHNLEGSLHSPMLIELRTWSETVRSAISDGLTGLYNHSFFQRSLRREVQRAIRHSRELALLLLDLDDFKSVNDQRGHVEGDRVLELSAAAIRSELREIDVAARYGGEEFAVLLPDTTRSGGHAVADRIRRRIAALFQRAPIRVTISGGVAACPVDAVAPEELVRRADAGLYHAKANGKNRIVTVDGNRRRHPRMPARHRVRLSQRGGLSATTRTKNASPEGVLLALAEPPPVGSQLQLLFESVDEADALGVSGQVVRVAPTTRSGLFDVAVRLEAGGGVAQRRLAGV